MPKCNFVNISDIVRSHENIDLGVQRVSSKLEFYNEDGEMVWEPLHNKTVIAGAALTLQKLLNLDASALQKTPPYDHQPDASNGSGIGFEEAANDSEYPTIAITDTSGNVIGSMQDESQRCILGFCVGTGGAGLDVSDVFEVNYASRIEPDNLVPFRYPVESLDDVDETIYKGRKVINDGDVNRCAYYFKEFSNTPKIVQNYVSTIGTRTDDISADTVYARGISADKAQSYVELHLKITKDDCREFFIAHKGLEQAKINQISLVYGWRKEFTRSKLNSSGSIATVTYEQFQQVRPFSICNIPTRILADMDESISIIYTLYA